MAEERKNANVVFDIANVVKQLENATNIKFKLVNVQDPEYTSLGQLTETDLTDLGFEFIGYSSNIKCPIYRYGKNIEAIFNETILHIYDLNSCV